MANPKTKVELKEGTVLISPRITEKAALGADRAGVYVFNITRRANKTEVAKAVKTAYKVTPERVHIANYPAKSVFVRGKWGTKGGGKKAYVYLKKGDKIEII